MQNQSHSCASSKFFLAADEEAVFLPRPSSAPPSPSPTSSSFPHHHHPSYSNSRSPSMLQSTVHAFAWLFTGIRRRRTAGLLLVMILLGATVHFYPSPDHTQVIKENIQFRLSGTGFLKYGYPLPGPDSHPISELIKHANYKWEKKVSRQSKSLRQAVEQYRTRYGRAPPKGFDLWYQFCVDNQVQLVDEYDSINSRIEPFFAIPSSVLQKRKRMLLREERTGERGMEDWWMSSSVFGIRFNSRTRKFNIRGPQKDNARGIELTNLLLPGLEKYLDQEVDIVVSTQDTPLTVMSGEAKLEYLRNAKHGTVITEQEAEMTLEDPNAEGWASLCLPHSRMRSAPKFSVREATMNVIYNSMNNTFISNHLQSLDICRNWEVSGLHGILGWAGPRPGLLFPVLSHTTDVFHGDLLLPPVEQYTEEPITGVPWEEKTDKIVWRGSTTGSDMSNSYMRKWSQRPRLCGLSATPGEVELLMAEQSTNGILSGYKEGKVFTAKYPAKEVSNEYFDFAFAGTPVQCEKEACEDLAKLKWDKRMSLEEMFGYKMIMDVDGNGWSGRFFALMSSGSLVLKSTIFPEWWMDRAEPWVHYVPVSVDYHDLWHIAAFFFGDPVTKIGSHDDLAKEIASNGKEWAAKYWRKEDMQAYLLRMILEYTRVMNRDPDHPELTDYHK